MKIFRFDASVGRSIDSFGSENFVLAQIVQLCPAAQVSCAYLGAQGKVGYHPAAAQQLFLVLQGTGRVRGETSERVPIHVGYAAFWEKGEGHEIDTDLGILAIVIEAESIDPAEFMTPVA